MTPLADLYNNGMRQPAYPPSNCFGEAINTFATGNVTLLLIPTPRTEFIPLGL